jgi:cytochrome bd-type quinol oxidase subunit 1
MALFTITVVKPTDARGWIGLGSFLLTVAVLVMVAIDKTLLHEQAFLVLATAIIVTGWINGPVGWAYQATKGGGEAAESSARIAEKAAAAAIPKE